MFLSKLRPAFLSLAEYTIYGPCYSRPQTSISRWMLLKQQATVPCTLKLCHEPEQRLYFGARVKLTSSRDNRRCCTTRWRGTIDELVSIEIPDVHHYGAMHALGQDG